jgi:hypothetical protein
MSINQFSKYNRIIITGLFPFLILLLITDPGLAGQDPSEEAGVHPTNIRWSVKDDVIIINYDLASNPDSKYKVDITMKRETDPEFTAIPLSVEGDIGEGYFAGTNKEIRWYYRRDYPQGFQGEGYFFEISIIETGKESAWLYYAIGAAAVTGGVLAFLISKNQGDIPVGTIPGPPGRP